MAALAAVMIARPVGVELGQNPHANDGEEQLTSLPLSDETPPCFQEDPIVFPLLEHEGECVLD
jgi:hypothetical protein